MRTVNPDDLDELAKLLDGRGGLQDKLDEAFTRASRLGVTAKVSALRPLRSWACDTAPDLRRRATVARLEEGHPEAGLLWAGFRSKELSRVQVAQMNPEDLALACAVATSSDPASSKFKRESNESLDDWLPRLRAHAISRVSGLDNYEPLVRGALKAASEWHSLSRAGILVTSQGAALTRVFVNNAVVRGPWKRLKVPLGLSLRRSNVQFIKDWGSQLIRVRPVKSLSAPGTWLPSRIGALFQRSSAYQAVTRIPVMGIVRDRMLGRGYDVMRTSVPARAASVNTLVNFAIGSDELARRYGGKTHARVAVQRAAQARLTTVGKAVFQEARKGGASRSSAFSGALKGATRTAGFFRTAGVLGGLYGTGRSAVNVALQGNPKEAFKREGAGYVADVAEVGFNASLTAATVAPNPVTIGLAVGTGLVYAGAKVVANWDEVKAGASKAASWAGKKAAQVGKETLNAAKDLAKKADPRNWF